MSMNLLGEILRERLDVFAFTPQMLLERDAPGGLHRPGAVSANGHCRLIEARDGWIALNLARAEDIELVPALTGGRGGGWQAIRTAASDRMADAFRDLAIELQLPVAVLGEAPARPLAAPSRQSIVGARVIDMSALWAGPLCAALLARRGADVLRIESLGRPDPTPILSPRLFARIDAGKRTLPLDLRRPEDRAQLHAQIAASDILVTSGRRDALARLGLDPDRMAAANPKLRWVAITAHGFDGPGARRVGFGDDAAVAGGLVDRDDRGVPLFLGDALADPLTGLEAALAVLDPVCDAGLVDIGMAGVAAQYAAWRLEKC